jgi:hypothetical protein
MFVSVFLVVCVVLGDPATCTRLPIIDNTQEAAVTMMGCLGSQGEVTARSYWETHKELHKNYHFGGWACQIGNKKATDKQI